MPSPSNSLRRARPLLGTLVEITAGGDPAILSAAVERAFAAIERVHQLMSVHERASDVSRLNRGGHRGAIEVDPQTWVVLAQAQRVSAASGGAFDVTVAPRLVEWGYLPAAEQPLPRSRPGGYRLIELLVGHRVRFGAPLMIDLGGIAKGYAVDVACAALSACGVANYVVNAGGDLRVGGAPAIVHLRHPRRPVATLVLGSVRDCAIATSASYFAGRDGNGGRVHPIVAPATGAPACDRGSISVRAADCMTADALTKVVAVLGTAAQPALAHLHAEAILLSDAGDWLHLSPRARDSSRSAVRRPAAAG